MIIYGRWIENRWWLNLIWNHLLTVIDYDNGSYGRVFRNILNIPGDIELDHWKNSIRIGKGWLTDIRNKYRTRYAR